MKKTKPIPPNVDQRIGFINAGFNLRQGLVADTYKDNDRIGLKLSRSEPMLLSRDDARTLGHFLLAATEPKAEPKEGDGTWRESVNDKPRKFHPTLDAAINWALANKHFADLTNQQAAEYIRRFPLTDNQNEPHELWRNILDCGCSGFNGHRFDSLEDGEECYCGVKYEDAEEPCPIENHFCFTTVVDDDLEEDDYEDPSDYVHGWECFRVEPNDQYKVKA